MTSSFEKSVKGATKIKAAPPKTKYIEHIIIATHSGEAGVAEVFRSLQNRLRDSTWTVVFKSLITVHFMIREGAPDVTLHYLSRHRNMLAISAFSDVQTQGRNIRHYSEYLTERARAYRETKVDWVRGAEPRLEKLSVEKGLLRETECVQHQLTALLKCDVLDNEPENEITITVFRMLVLDLLQLFNVLNHAMINLLGHFFEMSKPDAERAMEIYRNFSKQTDYVVGYLSVARQYEHHTRVEVPKLKHAPVNLGRQLEDYLKDPDFEVNRRQYLAEQEAKRGRKAANGKHKPFPSTTKSDAESRAAAGRAFPDAPSSNSNSQPTSQPAAPTPVQPAKGPDHDLIDFFDSIEQNQQSMATQSGQQQMQMAPGQYGVAPPYQSQQAPAQPFQQTGLIQQPTGFQNQPQFPQQQSFNNVFGSPPPQDQQQQQQMPQQISQNFTGAGFGGYTSQQPSFQSSLSSIPQDSPASFQNSTQGFNSMPTGQSQLQPQPTNPFRASMMTQQTGMSNSSFNSVSSPVITPVSRQSTNPFAKSTMTSPPTSASFSSLDNAFGQSQQAPASQGVPQQQQQIPQQQNNFMQPQQSAAPMQPAQTGSTNPFARNLSPQTTARPTTAGGGLMPQPTGNTNPFRQSAFVNTQTGQGWQNNQQPIGGGLDALETVPVFPRPAQQQPWG